MALWACAAPVHADSSVQPSGQFQPSRADRDGDGIPDSSDCAPDDPTRPARSGTDADCDGTPDTGEQVASRPTGDAKPTDASLARAVAHGKVAVVHGLRVSRLLSTYRMVHAAPGTRAFVFVAADNCALRITPTLFAADGTATPLAVRSHAVPAGSTFVVRVAVGAARDVRLDVVAIDPAGKGHSVTRTLRLGHTA